MPLYEYQCEACDHRFEKIQRFSDPLVEICPKCGGRVKKLLSSPAIQFKGSGWYINDYAKKAPADSTKKPADSSTSADTPSTTTADTAPKDSTKAEPAKKTEKTE